MDNVEFREFSTEERKRLAKDGKAMPDGSFPIVTREDLENAIQAIGRASNPEMARRHIIKRARALGLTDLLPKNWGSAKMSDKRYSPKTLDAFWHTFDSSIKQGADTTMAFENARLVAKALEDFNK